MKSRDYMEGGRSEEGLTIIEVVETLSEADGSAGWTVLIGNSTAFFAWLDPSVAKEMIGDDTETLREIENLLRG